MIRLAALLFILSTTALLPAADLTIVLTNQKQEPVGDAVVSLHRIERASPSSSEQDVPPASREIVQQDGEFSPYVSAVRVGTAVTFPNRDKVKHHVYSLSAAKRFEIPLHSAEAAKPEIFDQAGVVSVGCNIHDWMLAYIVIVDTPWFAVVPLESGQVTLNAPAGTYRCTIWHPLLSKPHEREVVLSDGVPSSLEDELKLRPDRRPKRNLSGAGGSY